MVLMANKESGVVAVSVREQGEIFKSRRKNRRSRINSVHAEVRAILQVHDKDGRIITASQRKSN
jgi:tRNA(Arg) A34 adenosine deaminase TadA